MIVNKSIKYQAPDGNIGIITKRKWDVKNKCWMIRIGKNTRYYSLNSIKRKLKVIL